MKILTYWKPCGGRRLPRTGPVPGCSPLRDVVLCSYGAAPGDHLALFLRLSFLTRTGPVGSYPASPCRRPWIALLPAFRKSGAQEGCGTVLLGLLAGDAVNRLQDGLVGDGHDHVAGETRVEVAYTEIETLWCCAPVTMLFHVCSYRST